MDWRLAPLRFLSMDMGRRQLEVAEQSRTGIKERSLGTKLPEGNKRPIPVRGRAEAAGCSATPQARA